MPAASRASIQLALDAIAKNIVNCERCPRLRGYCSALGQTKRRAYLDWNYWARPVPGFGDPAARVIIVGLAPGAHGANRTGRPFTGDGAGNFMYPVLYDTGFASQPDARSAQDGLRLHNIRILSVCRCAPPADKPTPQEQANCSVHLSAELSVLRRARVIVALGRIAFDGYLRHLQRNGVIERASAYPFGHAVEHTLPDGTVLLCSYHPSLRNTNTGRLNRAQFTRIFVRARELAGLDRERRSVFPSVIAT